MDRFSSIEKKGCSAEGLLIEMDRILGPTGFIIIRDTQNAYYDGENGDNEVEGHHEGGNEEDEDMDKDGDEDKAEDEDGDEIEDEDEVMTKRKMKMKMKMKTQTKMKMKRVKLNERFHLKACCGGLHFSDILTLNLDTMMWNSLATIGQKPST